MHLKAECLLTLLSTHLELGDQGFQVAITKAFTKGCYHASKLPSSILQSAHIAPGDVVLRCYGVVRTLQEDSTLL